MNNRATGPSAPRMRGVKTALRRMHPMRVFGLDSLSGTDWELDEVLAMADPAPMVPRRSQSTRARPIS
jgi:hypothetical protein